MVLVGIAGGSAAGKSTIGAFIAEAVRRSPVVQERSGSDPDGLSAVVTLDMDSYYRDLSHCTPEQRIRHNFDHPNAVDWDRYCDDLRWLKEGRPVQKPSYDFATHTRGTATQSVGPAAVVIAEGLLLFVHPSVRALLDVKVFIETPADIRVLRRIERDVRERGRSVSGAVRQYLESVRPMHDEFVEPTKAYADLLISGCGDNQAELQDVCAAIERVVRSRRAGAENFTIRAGTLPASEPVR